MYSINDESFNDVVFWTAVDNQRLGIVNAIEQSEQLNQAMTWTAQVMRNAHEGWLEDVRAAMAADPRMNTIFKTAVFKASLDGLYSDTAIYLAEELSGELPEDTVASEVALLRAAHGIHDDRELFAAGIRDQQISAAAHRAAIYAAFDNSDSLNGDIVELLREAAFNPSDPYLLLLKAIALGDQAKVAQALADPHVQPAQNENLALALDLIERFASTLHGYEQGIFYCSAWQCGSIMEPAATF